MALADTRYHQGVEKVILLVDIAAIVHVSKASLQPLLAYGHPMFGCDDRDEGIGGDDIVLELQRCD